MRRTYKKIFGFVGLALVAVLTIFAATLPNPEALAASSSVTDSIVVRVLAGTADVNITKPTSGGSYANPNQVVEFNFSDVVHVTATLEYKDLNGVVKTFTLHDADTSIQPGSKSINLDLSGINYGYGDYKATVRGRGQTGVDDEDVVVFSYVPVTATVEEDDETGKVYSILDYDDNNVDIDHFVINIYDEDGNLVDKLSPILVNKPDKKIELPFAENNIPDGKYTVSVSAIDVSGGVIYKSYDVVFVYKAIKVPNTGGIFAGLNISKVDYLVTGFIIFALVGIGGVFFVAKGRSAKRK